MKFQVVVMAGGLMKKLFPLVSKAVPKALLPVGNRPVLSYVLELLEASNLKDIIVVVAGEDAAVTIGGWIAEAFVGRLNVEVAAVPEDVGTADALRAVLHRVVADDLMVLSGDLVCDVPLGAVAAAHSRQGAVVTALLCRRPTSGASEGGTGPAGKDKSKQPAPLDVIGLGPSDQSLLYLASGSQVLKEVRIARLLLRAAGQMEIRTDLVDAHLYAFNRACVQDVLEARPGIRSIKQDLVPYLVRSQLRPKLATTAASGLEEDLESMRLADDRGAAHDALLQRLEAANRTRPVFKCRAYLASKDKYCARLNSIQAFQDINRDVASEEIHLTGYTVSSHNNVIHPSAVLGSKTTVGPHCMLGEGSQLGDKCSVKRSVVGRHCRIGSNVKIMNSVLMNYVTVEDGSVIQGCIISSNVHLQERANLRDCQVGAGYVVGAGAEYRSEALARKEKFPPG